MMSSRPSRPPARLIIAAWGDSYIDEILGLTLPTVLAPGNLPALAEDFDCEVVLVTQQSAFERILSHPIIEKLQAIAPLKLVPVDDLTEVHGGYGLVLTYALHRGFEDLGDRVTDYYLLFLNADFILADDCYRALAEKMKAGERLIFAPSYCTVSEQAIPELQSRSDRETGVIAVPKREMANIILRNRHDTIWAKTVNRQIFRMHVSDQFYWYVDEHVLLGHQLPIAIVCMKPQVAYHKPVCFWDYATISMSCPTANRCVLGDSDEFVMLELRKRGTFNEHIQLGAASAKEVATALADYMTADQFEMGKYPLTLHDSDLPPHVEDERTKLRCHLDDIYARLPRTYVSHIGHKFWVSQGRDIEGLKERNRHMEADRLYRQQLIQATREPAPREMWFEIFVTGKGRHGRRSLSQILNAALFGRMPDVTMLHPHWASLRHAVAAMRSALNSGARNILVIESGDAYLKRFLAGRPGRTTRLSPLSLLKYGLPSELDPFDLVVCDLNWMEMNEFPRIYGSLTGRLADGATVVAFHSSPTVNTLKNRNRESVSVLVPRSVPTAVFFGGSPSGTAMTDRYQRRVAEQARLGFLRPFAHLAMMLGGLPGVLRQNFLAKRYDPHQISGICTSITIVARNSR